MARRSKYPQELMDRGVRLALESGRPVAQVARDLGIGHEALRKRVRQACCKKSPDSVQAMS
jgi:transposase